jgi:hypothetical protein
MAIAGYTGFSGGVAGFYTQNDDGYLYGFIDKTGMIIIDPIYKDYYPRTYDFNNEGIISVLDFEGKWGCIDLNGNVLVPFEYDAGIRFSEGYGSALYDGKWGVIDKNGEVIIPFEYDNIGLVVNGYIQVAKFINNQLLWGLININNRIIVPLRYKKLSDVHLGITAISDRANRVGIFVVYQSPDRPARQLRTARSLVIGSTANEPSPFNNYNNDTWTIQPTEPPTKPDDFIPPMENDKDAVFSISSIFTIPGSQNVEVEITASADCFLDVQILSDVSGTDLNWLEGTRLASGRVPITEVSVAEYIDVSVSSLLPQYFTVVATLVDNFGRELCHPFMLFEHTRMYERLEAYTIYDFDADRIINLDFDESTNFMVVSEDVIKIRAGAGGRNNIRPINENS